MLRRSSRACSKLRSKEKRPVYVIDIDSPTSVGVTAEIEIVLKNFIGFLVLLTVLNLYSGHRSCWKHIVALHLQGKKVSKREEDSIKERYEHISSCLSGSHPTGGRTRRNWRMRGSNLPISRQQKRLDTSNFQDYFEKLWGMFSEDKRASFAYLDSLCFNMYVQASCIEALPGTKDKVLKWVKQKQIFSKKYVLVPIVCWDHWSLLILCHFGGNWQSGTNTPCMLLLDSLEIAGPKRSEPNIRKFVRDIYRQEGRFLSKKMVSQIPLLIPKVPQQRDDVRCGYYVLYFIDEFIKKAPENFSILEGYPYFMQHDWFTPAEVDKFCTDKLEK